MFALVSDVTPAPLSTSCAASVLLSLLVPPNVSICVVFGALKVSGALMVKLIAPDPQDSSALPADDPSVNWRLVLSPDTRSAEPRVGKECVSTCRTRGLPFP